ncbi:hypothetical protein EUTSA_v10009451mg [Eutrema salsugineum]|uniref:F-box domain-containing protein n=1 Tax=Eutrema salsugineum TaxID=72664 RepID=V4KUM4_EUTSA|nr:putative F-box protein At1g30925 [Eutrema salsugineum]ESQ33747.1 hypothetical protein EUTSA_v10009451mg [Eutrema salsugineum]
MMKRREDILDSIPLDLSLEIFSRLPSKSIARFRSVSKQWGSMLHRQYFTELFLTRSWARQRLLITLEGNGEFRVFSSPQLQHPYGKSSFVVVSADFHVKFSLPAKTCGLTSGLICFSYNSINKVENALVPVIFNPTTRKYVSLPKLTNSSWYKAFNIFLGFDPIDKQFKVLFMPYPEFGNENRILTLGTGEMSWRKVQCPLSLYPLNKWICINGVLYYLADRMSDGKWPSLMIVCFDVRSEKFKFIEAEECFYATLINYKGKLGGIREIYDNDSNTLELRMWVLEDVEKQEWSKYVYTLQDDEFVDLSFVTVAGVTETGEIVLSMYKSNLVYVIYFNPERSTHQSIGIQGFGDSDYNDVNRHTASVFVDYVEDLNVNDLKYIKSSQDLNIFEE